ncbi:MAG: Flp pilus assembly complex ATPase component TadA [Candidatus Omnitrophica bacterium]|nr:Flp pilus assembly complex ATPase component TadA [Candidatus Omnitrophota bacterium]
MLNKTDQLLANALVEKRLVSKEISDSLLQEAAKSDQPFIALLVSRDIISQEDALRVLADILEMEYADLDAISVSRQVLDKVPVKIASYYKFFPLGIHERVLTIAVSTPLDVKTEDEIRMQLGFDVRCVLSRYEDITKMLKAHYGIGAETIGQIIEQTPQEAPAAIMEAAQEKIEDIEKQAQEASVIKLVNQILLEAYKKRATDIHIEPYRSKVRLRYRVDGVLYDTNVSPEIRRFIYAILSRIKIMANLNIVERRLSQDGRAVVKTQDQTLDLRVSFIPTPYGESVVIRILPSKMLFSLEKLGLSGNQQALFEDLIEKPHGIIFVTGPTGSGKTTTLYACLSKINTSERKIITIEDPIEYEMEGITQIQVMPEIGWTFGKGLRSMLRHDPDVMMVGEVRDLETAEIAIRVALTGHLVFSTLHTNDAASGITRLIDIGVEPYLVASSVEAFIAQRLVRVICSGCKKEVPLDSDDAIGVEIRKQIATDLGLASFRDVKLYKGHGCAACNMTGFFGRTGIYENLLVDSMIKELIVKKAPSAQIKRIAVSRGMKTLRQDGWLKVVEGLTAFDEVVKVTQAEEVVLAPQAVGAVVAPIEIQGKRIATEDGKRAYVRLESRVNIRYKVFKSLEEAARRGYKPENFSVTANISACGILFVASEAIGVGSVVELILELPDSSEPVACLAKVVRVEEIEPDKNYHIAIQFLDITSADKNRVNKFVLE